MVRFLIRRILQGLLTLFLMQTAVFFFVQIIMPGDFVSRFAMDLTSEEEAAWRTAVGLDLPIGQQYLNWLAHLATFDLGNSFYGPPVIDGILGALPYTVLVFATGITIAFWLGQWLGRMTAWKGPGLLSDSVTFTAITFYAFFPPALAELLKLTLGRMLNVVPYDLALFWLLFEKQFGPVAGSVITQMSYLLILIFAGVLVLSLIASRVFRGAHVPSMAYALVMVGAWVASWYAVGIGPAATQIMQSAIIPIIAFVLLSTGDILVITRTSMADTLNEQYIITARAKGLKESAIRDRHAARNAMLPILSKMVISLPYLLGGLAIIERSVRWEGMGGSLFSAVEGQDIPMILGYLLVIGLSALLARLLLEIAYAYLDPRIRFGEGKTKVN